MTTNYQASSNQWKSDDFINLAEPPRPKDTPSISEFCSPDVSFSSGENDNRERALPQPLERRRSTNYIDALNLRESGKDMNSNSKYNNYNYTTSVPPHMSGSYPSQRRKSSVQGMDFQDTKHDMQNLEITSDEESYKHHSKVDMGDHVEHGDIASPRNFFKDNYKMDENRKQDTQDSNNNNASATTKKPNLYRRRSSFEYEDFKKDIYDRLKFFEE